MGLLLIGSIAFRMATAHIIAQIGAIRTRVGGTGVTKGEWLQDLEIRPSMPSRRARRRIAQASDAPWPPWYRAASSSTERLV